MFFRFLRVVILLLILTPFANAFTESATGNGGSNLSHAAEIVFIFFFFLSALFNTVLVFADKNPHYLKITAAAMVLIFRTGLSGNSLFMRLFPLLETGLGIRLSHMAMILPITLIMAFFNSVSPSRKKAPLRASIQILCLVLSAAVFVIPMDILAYSPTLLRIVSAFAILLIAGQLRHGSCKPKSATWVSMAGLFSIFLIIPYELLLHHGIFNGPGLEALGYTVFFFSQWLVFPIRLRHETIMRETLASEMESMVRERTKNLAKANSRLKILSETDSLTLTANRHRLDRRLNELISEARRYERHFSIIIADLDRFKIINDCWGHSCGDNVLKEFSLRMQGALRETDLLGRYGGEEFLLLLPETDRQGAVCLAERLRVLVIDRPFSIAGPVSCSFGVGVWNEDGKDAEDLLKAADRRLYQAKKKGRNRVEGGNSEPYPDRSPEPR